jgi:hypothetical protein
MQSLQILWPVPGAHGVVYNNERERADIISLALYYMHFRNLFTQRTAGNCHTQGVSLEISATLVTHALGAGIGIPIVAVDTMIDFIQDLPLVVTAISQGKTIPASMFRLRSNPGSKPFALSGLVVDQMLKIGLFRRFETDPAGDRTGKMSVM